MELIDAWIVDKVERFSHFTQLWFGIAAPSWERLFLVLAILQLLFKEIPRDWGKAVLSVGDGLLVLMYVGRFRSSLKRTPARAENATRNPNKLIDCWARTIGLVFALLFLPFDIAAQFTAHPNSSFWYQCSQLAYYFAACDDLPWSASKVRQMLRSVAAALKMQPQTAGARAVRS